MPAREKDTNFEDVNNFREGNYSSDVRLALLAIPNAKY